MQKQHIVISSLAVRNLPFSIPHRKSQGLHRWSSCNPRTPRSQVFGFGDEENTSQSLRVWYGCMAQNCTKWNTVMFRLCFGSLVFSIHQYSIAFQSSILSSVSSHLCTAQVARHIPRRTLTSRYTVYEEPGPRDG